MGRRILDWQHRQIIRDPSKPLKVPNKEKEDAPQCSACGAVIGFKYMETMLYPVGEFGICGWCHKKMLERGRIELLERIEARRITYLYLDGTTVKEKRRRVKYVQLNNDKEAPANPESRDGETTPRD